METNIEQDIPVTIVICVFLFLTISSTLLRRYLRKRHLIREGQVFAEKGQILPIEKRLAGNREWSSGEIVSKGNFFVFGLWLLTLGWNLTFGVSFVKSLTNPAMPLGGRITLGVFAVLGIVPFFFAIRTTIWRLRYGKSTCRINGKAGVLGREMTGIIRTKKNVPAIGNYSIAIECIETYTTGSGKESRTEVRQQYRDSKQIAYSGISTKAGIPFSFTLPTYPPETGHQLSRGQINWQLRINAPVKGVDYSALFIVPVFKMD